MALIGPSWHVVQTAIAVFLKEKHARHPQNTLCMTKQDMIKNNFPLPPFPRFYLFITSSLDSDVNEQHLGICCLDTCFIFTGNNNNNKKKSKPSVAAAVLFIFNVFFLSRQMIHCLTISKFILKKITPQMHPNICPIYIYSIPSVHLQNILNNCDCNSCILIGRLVCESGRSPTRLTGSSVEDKRCNPGSRGCREFYGQW